MPQCRRAAHSATPLARPWQLTITTLPNELISCCPQLPHKHHSNSATLLMPQQCHAAHSATPLARLWQLTHHHHTAQ